MSECIDEANARVFISGNRGRASLVCKLPGWNSCALIGAGEQYGPYTPMRELPIVLTGLEREMALNIKIENKPN